MVKALPPALKAMPSTCVMAERKTPFVFDDANVAVSEAPLGTVTGVQLVSVFQSLVGFKFQVALPAKAGVAKSVRAKAKSAARIFNIWVFMISHSGLFASSFVAARRFLELNPERHII